MKYTNTKANGNTVASPPSQSGLGQAKTVQPTAGQEAAKQRGIQQGDATHAANNGMQQGISRQATGSFYPYQAVELQSFF